jgi:hypothetical protein
MCKKTTIYAIPSKVGAFLKGISIGKYDQGLYLNERREQSSICGGLFTLLLIAVILTYSSVNFYVIVNREEYTIDESTLLFRDSGIFKQTIGQLENTLPKMFTV